MDEPKPKREMLIREILTLDQDQLNVLKPDFPAKEPVNNPRKRAVTVVLEGEEYAALERLAEKITINGRPVTVAAAASVAIHGYLKGSGAI